MYYCLRFSISKVRYLMMIIPLLTLGRSESTLSFEILYFKPGDGLGLTCIFQSMWISQIMSFVHKNVPERENIGKWLYILFNMSSLNNLGLLLLRLICTWQKQRSKSIHPTLIGMSPNGHANAGNCQRGQITASKKLMIFWWRPMCVQSKLHM